MEQDTAEVLLLKVQAPQLQDDGAWRGGAGRGGGELEVTGEAALAPPDS